MRFSLFLLFFGIGIFAAAQIVRGEPAGQHMKQYQVLSLTDMLQPEKRWLQLRVKQRVIVRIPNVRRRQSQALGFSAPASAPKKKRTTFEEKKIGKCLWLKKLESARPGKGKKQNLELVTKSGGIIRAYLGDGCLAREFYAGAYMEKAKDGRLCIERDIVHARTGAKCEIDKFRLLVASK